MRLLASGILLVFCTIILSSCGDSGGGGTSNTYTPVTVKFKQGFNGSYDLFLVDTADAQGNNGDHIINDSVQRNVQELVLSTSAAYPSANGNAVISMLFNSAPPDSNYYYQDKDGFLWRYNYGFNILNKYSDLTNAIGGPVNVGWVLVAKPGAPSGTTWVGKNDSANIQTPFGNVKVYLNDAAMALNDTSFVISDSTIKTTHVRHTVTATVQGISTTAGQIVVDTYLSSDLGMTVEDFFHHSVINYPTKIQSRGSLKIMTNFNH